MKIIIKCGGRYKDDEKAEGLLNSHAKYMDKLLNVMSKKLRFKLPAKLVLRPLYCSDWPATAGRLNYCPRKGYSIALHVEVCKRMWKKGKSVVDHECAHLANVMLHKDWGHGERFHKIRSAACKLRQSKSSKTKTQKSLRQ